jgi:hypothetical protein
MRREDRQMQAVHGGNAGSTARAGRRRAGRQAAGQHIRGSSPRLDPHPTPPHLPRLQPLLGKNNTGPR